MQLYAGIIQLYTYNYMQVGEICAEHKKIA